MEHESFCNLSYEMVSSVLDRDSLNIEEIELFQAIHKWCTSNSEIGEKKKVIYDKIRYAAIPRKNLISTVRPTGVVNSDQLLDIIFTQDGTPKEQEVHPYRAISVPGKDVAANAKVEWTTNEERNQACFKLGKRYFINYIHLNLNNPTNSYYSYSKTESLSVSSDGKTWSTVSTGTNNYSYFTSHPSVSFLEQQVRYIRFESPFYDSSSNISLSAILKQE
uniref:BACK domain-containing protein n=1 Tax=Anopheles quadriannulatus TaxID=34691 RepID=A0A182XRD6_ANOQN